jgi:hypothetical protein
MLTVVTVNNPIEEHARHIVAGCAGVGGCVSPQHTCCVQENYPLSEFVGGANLKWLLTAGLKRKLMATTSLCDWTN